MANAANRAALQSEGGTDVYATHAHLLFIAEADPSHPHHLEHVERVRLDKPEMQALIASFREFGYQSAIPMAVYKDGSGKTLRFGISEGRRRHVAICYVNEERKKAGQPLIRPLVVLDKEPLLTTARSNEMREGDPPMVRARRYVELCKTMGAQKAAAAIGETLANANALAQILALPDAELHAAVNAKDVPIDVAKRAVKQGSAAVRKVVEATKGKTTAKGKAKAARKAAKAVHEPRARAQNANRIKAVAEHLMEGDGNVKVVAALMWASGSADEDPPTWLQKAIDAAKEGGA